MNISSVLFFILISLCFIEVGTLYPVPLPQSNTYIVDCTSAPSHYGSALCFIKKKRLYKIMILNRVGIPFNSLNLVRYAVETGFESKSKFRLILLYVTKLVGTQIQTYLRSNLYIPTSFLYSEIPRSIYTLLLRAWNLKKKLST